MELVQLLSERRYEEALELLQAARQRAPDVTEIARAIHLLKQRLLRRFLHELGDPHRVPLAAAGHDPGGLDATDRRIMEFVDGRRSFETIVSALPDDRFELFRHLALLMRRGVIYTDEDRGRVRFPVAPEAGERPRRAGEHVYEEVRTDAAEPEARAARARPRPWADERSTMRPARGSRALRWAGIVVGAVGLVALALWVMTDLVPAAGRPASGAMRAAAPLASSAAAPAGATSDVGSAGAASAAAAPEATRDSADSARAPVAGKDIAGREAARVEPPAASPAGDETDGARPQDRQAPTEPRAAAQNPAPAASVSPASPSQNAAPAAAAPAAAAPQAGAPAQEASPQAASPQAASPQAASPQGAGRASAPAAARAAAPRSSAAAAQSGSAPSREVIDQAIARMEPFLRSCYRETATRAGQKLDDKLYVSLTIDEIGMARTLVTSAGQLPGLLDCVRDRSGRLRQGAPPEHGGAVRVSFTVELDN